MKVTTKLGKKDLTGIVLLNKPSGMSSNKALQIVKRHFNAAKAGHVGTLDPLANGVLPLCFGDATKFAHILQASRKSYRVTATLGSTTTTGDSEGEVLVTQSVPEISEPVLLQVLQQFIGTLQQIPPMFSALKVNGQPLYKLARQGIVIARQPRTIVIDSLVLVAHIPEQFTLDVICSKGSYMRTLVEDIGQALGCGAHMSALTRTQVGSMSLEQCVNLEELLLTASHDLTALQSINILKPLLVNLLVSSEQELALRHGKQIPLAFEYSSWPMQDDLGLISQETNELIGLGKIIPSNLLVSQRLTQCRAKPSGEPLSV